MRFAAVIESPTSNLVNLSISNIDDEAASGIAKAPGFL